VRRTQQLLRDSFLALVLERGFEAVRVSEIIERAQVNRATFYRHYQSKYDLLQSWTNEVGALLDMGADSLEDPRANSGLDEYLPAVVVNIFEHIAAHRPYYRLMLGRKGLSSIASDMELQVIQFLDRRSDLFEGPLLGNGAPVGMLTKAYAAQFVGIVKWWLEEAVPPSPQQIARWTWNLPIKLNP
jgi:AcrR family transcriptional regulator